MNTKTLKTYRLHSRARFEELQRIVWQYRDMLEEMDSLATAAPSLDGMPRGTGTSDPTHAAAVRRDYLSTRVMAIEWAARVAAGDMAKGLLQTVTTRGSSYEWARSRGLIYMGRRQFYDTRRQFFWLLDRALAQKGQPNS